MEEELHPFGDVSRETSQKLLEFEILLKKWNAKINLVASSTVPAMRERHLLDSIQLFALMPNQTRHWVDLGSGAGFPGMIIAIIAAAQKPEMKVTLIESDARKAAFLSVVARTLQVSPTIYRDRVELLSPQFADVISARALAPLSGLLRYAQYHGHSSTVCLFPKGRSARLEIDAARHEWSFVCEALPSRTDPGSVILRIGDIRLV